MIARAGEAGVKILVNPAVDFPSNRSVADLSGRYPELYAAVGVHPHHAVEVTAEAMKELEHLLKDLDPASGADPGTGGSGDDRECPPAVRH